MIKLRLEGLPEELETYLENLQSDEKINILEKSGEYPNRGASKFVRIYVSIEVKK